MYNTYRDILYPVKRSLQASGYPTVVNVADTPASFFQQPNLMDAIKDKTPMGSPSIWDTIFREFIISDVTTRLLADPYIVDPVVDRTPEAILWYEVLPIGTGYWSYFVDEYFYAALSWDQFKLLETTIDEYGFALLDHDGDGAVSFYDLAQSYPAEFLAYCVFSDSSFASANPDSPKVAVDTSLINLAARVMHPEFPFDYEFPPDVLALFDLDLDGLITIDDILRMVLLPSAKILSPVLGNLWLKGLTNIGVQVSEAELDLDGGALRVLGQTIDTSNDGSISPEELSTYSETQLRAWHLLQNCPVDENNIPLPLDFATAQSVLADITVEEFSRMDRDADGIFTTTFNDFVDSDASIFYFGEAMKMFARFHWVLYGAPPTIIDDNGEVVPWTWRRTIGTSWWEHIYGDFGIGAGRRVEVIDDHVYEELSNTMWGMIGKGQLIAGVNDFYTDYCYIKMLFYYLPYLSCLLPRRNSNAIFDKRLAWEWDKITSFNEMMLLAGQTLQEITINCKEFMLPPEREITR
jgi:Ca2+-binding EF-hand superfamily protein